MIQPKLSNYHLSVRKGGDGRGLSRTSSHVVEYGEIEEIRLGMR
jgi:hypothetical protein